jgi:hypothetical protein
MTGTIDHSYLSPSAALKAPARSAKRLWVGRLLSGFAALFLAMDASLKLFAVPEAVEGTVQLGWPASVLLPLGIIQAICLILYLVPRTAIIGAVLWTGYLGGAIATHVRIGNPWFTHILFPIYVAVFLWGGLYLRDRRVSVLLARP